MIVNERGGARPGFAPEAEGARARGQICEMILNARRRCRSTRRAVTHSSRQASDAAARVRVFARVTSHLEVILSARHREAD